MFVKLRKSIIFISIVKTTRCTIGSNLFYFGMTLHLSEGLSVHHQEFKTVHTATGICQTNTADCLNTRSSKLYMQQQAFVKQILLTAWPSGVQNCTCSNRHLSNRYCCLLDHQEFKTEHTAKGICQTDTADCLTIRSSKLYMQQQAYVKQILLTA